MDVFVQMLGVVGVVLVSYYFFNQKRTPANTAPAINTATTIMPTAGIKFVKSFLTLFNCVCHKAIAAITTITAIVTPAINFKTGSPPNKCIVHHTSWRAFRFRGILIACRY